MTKIENYKNKIFNKDCLELLKELPDKSVDAIITDPPYMGVVNEKWDNQWANIDEYLDWCNEWVMESSRVLKRSGSFYIFGWSYQLSKLIPAFEKNGYTFKQDIVIWKGIQSAAGRMSDKLKMFPTTTEHLHFYYIDSKNYIRELLNEKRNLLGIKTDEINEYLGKASSGGGTWSSIAGINQSKLSEPTKQDWEKLDKLFGGLPVYEDIVYKFNVPRGVTDVFDDINFYDTEYRKDKFHPTQKPLKLIERIIECSTNENDIILDLFGGSCSLAIGCINTHRNYIISELNSEYYHKAQNWVDTHSKNTNTTSKFFEV
jgi:site-specific DNA-methyltransferase (adenine-specific)